MTLLARGMQVVKTGAASAQPSVTVTRYACSIGERAYEWAEKKHGVFSYYLMEGLRGGSNGLRVADCPNNSPDDGCHNGGFRCVSGLRSLPLNRMKYGPLQAALAASFTTGREMAVTSQLGL